MKKVIIIGPGGSGKSTLAKQIGAALSIDVFHLDQYYWKAGWVEPDVAEWNETVTALLAKDSWILDGNFGGTIDQRLAACDTAIFLDLPRLVCLYRVMKRRLRYRNTNRPDMTEGCNEMIDLEFLLWIWNYRKLKRPAVMRRLDSLEEHVNVIILKTSTDVKRFVSKLEQIG